MLQITIIPIAVFITDSVPSPIASTVVGRNLASDMSLYNPNVQYNQADTIGSDRKIWPIGTVTIK